MWTVCVVSIVRVYVIRAVRVQGKAHYFINFNDFVVYQCLDCVGCCVVVLRMGAFFELGLASIN